MPKSLQWIRISRWLYRSEHYDVTRREGVWRVTRRAHVGIEVGTSSDLGIAQVMAEDDHDLRGRRLAGEVLLPLGYLTPGHGCATMVPEDDDNNGGSFVSDTTPTPLPKCQCLSQWEDDGDPDGNPIRIYRSCNQTVARKRAFAPGHDAKLKSTLLKAFRAGEDITFQDGGVLISADPKELAKARGWEKFMTAAKPKKVKTEKAPEADKVDEQKAPEGGDNESTQPEGYQPARVNYRRSWRDGNIVEQNLTEVTVEFDYKGTAKRVTLPLNSDKLDLG